MAKRGFMGHLLRYQRIRAGKPPIDVGWRRPSRRRHRARSPPARRRSRSGIGPRERAREEEGAGPTTGSWRPTASRRGAPSAEPACRRRRRQRATPVKSVQGGPGGIQAGHQRVHERSVQEVLDAAHDQGRARASAGRERFQPADPASASASSVQRLATIAHPPARARHFNGFVYMKPRRNGVSTTGFRIIVARYRRTFTRQEGAQHGRGGAGGAVPVRMARPRDDEDGAHRVRRGRRERRPQRRLRHDPHEPAEHELDDPGRDRRRAEQDAAQREDRRRGLEQFHRFRRRDRARRYPSSCSIAAGVERTRCGSTRTSMCLSSTAPR